MKKTAIIKIFVLMLALAAIASASVSCSGSGNKSVDIDLQGLSNLRTKSASEAEKYFGKPDKYGDSFDDNALVYNNDDGRLTFYGIVIDALYFEPSNHSIAIDFSSANISQAKSKIASVASYGGGYPDSVYSGMKINVIGKQICFSFD